MASKQAINLLWLCVWCFVISYMLWYITLKLKPNDVVMTISEIKRNDQKHFLLRFLFRQNHIVGSILAGSTSLIISWTLTYFNWTHVGMFPATPLSPNKNNLNSSLAIFTSIGLAPLLISVSAGWFSFIVLSSL